MPTRKRQRRLPSAKAGPPKLLPPCSMGEERAVDEVAEREQFFRRWKAEGKPLALFFLAFHKVHENDTEVKTTLRLEGDDLVFRAVFSERLLGPLPSFLETTRSTAETEGNDAPRDDGNDEPSDPGNPDPCAFGPS